MRIAPPTEVKSSLPLSQDALSFISNAREQATLLLQGKLKKTALLVGPCSIHNPDEAITYAKALKTLSLKTPHLFLIMRVFLEKPRSNKGWKGFLYDPHLDHSHNIQEGLLASRKLLLDLANLQVPCAVELLDPLACLYFEDLISWGMIGARTSASQPHRQLASGLSFPIGFKNGVYGELDTAICGALLARDSHTHLSIDEEGRICARKTNGNPWTHLVLRGSNTKSNYDPNSIRQALQELQKHHLDPKILIDCSHGNSNKDHTRQASVFKESLLQSIETPSIFGLMLESHLHEGKQPFSKHPLHYGVSMTDSCIGWEETESLILWAEDVLSRSMSSVQK